MAPTRARIGEARSLSGDTSRPLQLVAVVTAVAPGPHAVYAEDDSGGILVLLPAGAALPRPGQRLELHGRMAWRGSERAFAAERARVLGVSPLPHLPSDAADVFGGAREARRVEIEGLVRETPTRDGETRLALAVSFGRLAVSLPGLDAEQAARLLDGRVRVRGVATARATPDGQRGAPRLLGAWRDDVTLLEPGAPDPFSAPLLRAADLDRLELRAERDHRVRVRGLVSRHRLGSGLYVIEGGRPLYVESAQGPQLEPGDEVEVVGFPAADARATLLEGSLWRRLGRGVPPAPRPVTATEVLGGAYEAELVRVEGRLLSHSREPNNEVLVLTAGAGFFNALVASDAAGPDLARLLPASRLALTGVVYLRRGGPGGSFDLLMRSGRDVTLLHRPSWAARHASSVARAVSLLALLALGWVVALRRQVGRQTRLVRTVVEENERRLTQIIDSLSEGMLALDGDGRVVLWNSAAERLCGRARSEALGRTLAATWPGLDTPELRQALARARERGEASQPLDVAGACAGQPGAVLEARVFPFAGGLTIFVDDVSAARLLVDELRRARSAAESAARAKTEFLANMSHEMRTPLNAVIGLTGPLLETPLDPEQRDLVATIRGSADALLAQVSGLLDFSKIDAGKLELESAPFVLRACLEDALRLVAERAMRSGLALGCDVGAGVPAIVEGDLTRVRQVLVNLVDNAVKFTAQGEVVVRVARGAALHALDFEVRDTGPGIPEAARARLFQPFAQLDASTTRRFGGTGLGLALCQRLVERMGGRLELRAAGGQGAVFGFTLELRAARGPASGPDPELLRGRRALLLAAGDGVRAGLASDLRAWGLDVRASGEVEQVLAWLGDSAPPDVALLDLDLETGRVREILGSLHVALIGLSWSTPAPGTLPVASSVLRKPVRLARLEVALRGALRRDAPGTPADAISDVRRLADLVPLRILVAEDNPVNQKVALLTLRGLGYAADLAKNGLEVLSALRQKPYDVVIMDVQMPEMDGLEAARRIRAEWPTDGPRILALTASAFVQDRERCRAAGMDGFVAKPLDLADLRRALFALAPGAPADAAEPALDPRVIDELRAAMSADGRDGFGSLCGLFLETAGVRLGHLRAALERADPAALAGDAHTLLGSSSTLGARRLARLLGTLEEHGRDARVDAARSTLVEVELEFARVREALLGLRHDAGRD